MNKKVLINGKFYTENPLMPWAEGVVIEGKNIAFVGSNEAAKAYALANGNDFEITDLAGRTVLPGLIDGHSHPAMIAKDGWVVSGDDVAQTKEDVFSAIKQCIKDYPPEKKPYLVYSYYSDEAVFGGFGPTIEDLQTLDEITGNRPVRINDDTGHGCWYNSCALNMLKGPDGIPTSESPISGVTFVQDENGAYTGRALQTFHSGDIGVFEAINWRPSDCMNDENAPQFFDISRHYGVTCIMEAGVGTNDADMEYLFELDKAGKLNMHYEACSLLSDINSIDEAIERARRWQEKYTTDHIRTNIIKFFGDGSNEFGDVLSTEPFPCNPDTCGACNCTVEQMRDVMVRLNQEGLDLHMHTVCDGTIRVMLDACEQAQKICGKDWKIRVTLAHCEIIHPDDIPRFKELGVWVDWTPSWGGDPALEIIPFLGKDRWAKTQDYSQIMKDADIVGFSTDEISPIDAAFLSPFRGIQIGITRIRPDIEPSLEYYPNGFRDPERAKMTLKQMIHGFTMTNAKRMRLDHLMGSIEVGKLANLVVLEDDIFIMPVDAIQDIEIFGTYFEGKELHIPNPLIEG